LSAFLPIHKCRGLSPTSGDEMDKFIPLSVPNLKGSELEYVASAIKDEWVSTGGAYINQFEKNISQYVSSSGAVACQSGTAGLHLSLLAYDIGADDEVIVPALTFIAAVNPVKYVGADPVFMDCDDSLCMDIKKLEEFCEKECVMQNSKLIDKSSNKHIKAVIIVHVFGNMADMEHLMNIAEKYNLIIIEDATEALGTYYIKGQYNGKFAGTIGHIGVYSFNGNKIITTGGGGMVVSDNIDILAHIKYLSTQAKDDEVYFIHNEIGYNYRMTNLQAALGIAQLEQLENFIKIKRDNYHFYKNNGIKLLPFDENIRANYWFYSYETDKRDELIKYLHENKIQTRPIWNLINNLPPYKNCQAYKIEKAVDYWNRIVNLPCSTNLTLEDAECVCANINKFNM